MDVEHPPKLPKGKKTTKNEKGFEKLFATKLKLLLITFGFFGSKLFFTYIPVSVMARSYFIDLYNWLDSYSHFCEELEPELEPNFGQNKKKENRDYKTRG